MAVSSVAPNTLPHAPRHVAIIMDGNGRWARQRVLPRAAGHRAGIKPVRQTVEHCLERGVATLTLFAFSSENWRRPREEVRLLMALLRDTLEREVAELHSNGVKLTFIGDRERLTPELAAATLAAEQRTAANSRMQLVIAIAYGGRWDIVQAARRLAAAAAAGTLDPAAIDELSFAGALETGALQPVDLLIRTGGEKRVSNFLLWDIAYSELYFSDVLWPEFGPPELERAIEFYARRQRRFGQTGEQVEAASC